MPMNTKQQKPILLVAHMHNASGIRHATGFHAPDPFLYLRHKGRHHLIVSVLEAGRAQQAARRCGSEVWTPERLRLSRDARRLSDSALALLRHLRLRHIEVDPAFPLAMAEQLRGAGIRVDVLKAQPFPKRQIKTEAELRAIVVSQRAAVAAMRRAARLLKQAHADRRGYLCVGSRRLTSEAVRREINIALLERDCTGSGTIVSCGAAAAEPHDRGSGPLKAGLPVVIDIFPQHMRTGYWGDLTRTFIKPPVERKWIDLWHTVRAAHEAALGRVKPGVSFRSVHRAAQDAMEQRGYRTDLAAAQPSGFIHSIGHGVGLDVHEDPFVGKKTRLRSGHVITIEPGFYFPGQGGVRIEDLVVVTPGGANIPVRCPYGWKV